jgi:hypothetical protein
MEDDSFSYVNQSFVEDTYVTMNIMECEYENTTIKDPLRESPAAIDEDMCDLYSNSLLDEKSFQSKSSQDINLSCSCPDVTFERTFEEKRRWSSYMSVADRYTLPRSPRKPTRQSASSVCSVHSYIDVEDIFGKPGVNASKRIKRRRTSRSASENLQLICSGITVVEEDKIVVVTKSGEILVFGNPNCITSLAKFSESFEDVTTLSKTEIAASCGFCIKFFEIREKTIVEMEEKCIDYQYSGEITVHALHFVPKKFIISCNLQSCVQHAPFIRIVNLKGHILKTFEIPTLASPGHLSSTADGKLIFLTDQAQKKVVAVSHCGSVKWEIATDNVPQYVAFNGKTTVFVSFERESELRRITTDGKTLSPLETMLGPRTAPFPLCYSELNKTLFFCSELHHYQDREFVHSIKTKNSKVQKLAKFFKK